MARLKKIILLATVCSLCFMGCGEVKTPENISENALYFHADGVVTHYLVDDFDKSFYSVDELNSMACEEASVFNEKNDLDSVKIVNTKVLSDSGNKVMIETEFKDVDAYNAFNNANVVYGTVGNQISKLVAIDTLKLKSAKQDKTISTAQISGMQNQHMIICDVDTVIYCPYQVAYMSEGLNLREDGVVEVSGTDTSKAVIIMKK